MSPRTRRQRVSSRDPAESAGARRIGNGRGAVGRPRLRGCPFLPRAGQSDRRHGRQRPAELQAPRRVKATVTTPAELVTGSEQDHRLRGPRSRSCFTPKSGRHRWRGRQRRPTGSGSPYPRKCRPDAVARQLSTKRCHSTVVLHDSGQMAVVCPGRWQWFVWVVWQRDSWFSFVCEYTERAIMKGRTRTTSISRRFFATTTLTRSDGSPRRLASTPTTVGGKITSAIMPVDAITCSRIAVGIPERLDANTRSAGFYGLLVTP
jgi:hypothetical protein